MILLPAGAAALWGSSRLSWDGTGGAERAPALVPLAMLAVTGVAGVLATSGWPRRLVGLLLGLAGLAAGWVVFSHGLWLSSSLALLGGILLVAAGFLLVRAGHRMPRLGARYEAPAAAKTGVDPEKDMWRALSEGDDPTVNDR